MTDEAQTPEPGKYDEINSDIALTEAKIRQIVQTINQLDAQTAQIAQQKTQIIAELNAHQGVLRFLNDKLPDEKPTPVKSDEDSD